MAAGGAARLEKVGPGEFRVSGVLSFDSVAAVFKQARELLAGNDPLRIDLAGVERSDSAGLALLVEWTRQARAAGRSIGFANIPEQMRTIAAVSGLEAVLPLVDSEARQGAE